MEQTSTTPPEQINKKKGFWGNLKEWAQVIVIALIISIPIRVFIAEPFIVDGASMDPTFATGQFLIVDRLSYRIEAPSRGDVIVFKYPNNPSIYYIKRIIGLPGETLDIKDGRVSVVNQANGTTTETALNEPYVADAHRSHETIREILGANEYFVMGDNRAESSDSRFWGPLDKGFIVGRPLVRLSPLNAISALPGQFHQ